MSLRFMGKLFARGLICSLTISGATLIFAESNESTTETQSNSAITALLDAEISGTAETTQENTTPSDNTTETTTVQDTNISEHGLKIARSTIVFRPVDGEAPLQAPIRWAREVSRNMESNIADYTCTVTKRERINGILGKEEVMSAKVRHKPFSVYLCFKQPRRVNGREVIFVENANHGELQAHGVGFEALAGTLSLKPDGRMAMKGNRHPITDMGMLNLAKQLIIVGEKNLENPCISVRYFDAELNGRDCVCVEVMNNDRKKDPLFYKGQIFVDMELNIPIKFISWGWGNGRDFPLMEEYTYSDIQLNPGLTDKDFDIRNPEYNYRESR